jgi:prepilin-type N-terminal cleavage/methylation domain-containing protein
MNTSRFQRRPIRGFTLVELLVVIAIIIVLAAMGLSVGANAIKKARMLQDKSTATNLAIAIGKYYQDYGYYPEIDGSAGDTDTTTRSDAKLMNTLLAFGTDGRANNPRGTVYFSGSRARGSSAAKAYRGLFYTGSSDVELFDAWKKKAPAKRHFQVAMDTNHDGKLFDPFDRGVIIHGIPVLVWSTGKDGEDASTGANDPKNRDNSQSW